MSSKIAVRAGFDRTGTRASDRTAAGTHLVCPLVSRDRWVKLAVTGTAAGLFSGLFGVGGGTVIVPLLVLWLGYGERQATGTSLAAIVPIAVAGVIVQAAYGNVHVDKAALVGLPAVAGVLVGTALQQ